MLSSPETLVLTRLVDCSPRGLFCSLARLYEENLRAKHITVTVIFPTQGFKWIPADYRGNINIRQCDHHFVGLAALSGSSRTFAKVLRYVSGYLMIEWYTHCSFFILPRQFNYAYDIYLSGCVHDVKG